MLKMTSKSDYSNFLTLSNPLNNSAFLKKGFVLYEYKLRDAIYGLAIGDALGVPYEFRRRDTFNCTRMRGWGKYFQPPGTWSDDTSMTLALLDAMSYTRIHNPDLKKLSSNFVKWMYLGKFSIYRYTFDVGLTTRRAIHNMVLQKEPTECGMTKEKSKGNGSLMRILPLIFCLWDCTDFYERKQLCFDVSALTHRTETCQIACHFYVEFALKILKGAEKYFAYRATITEFKDCYKSSELYDFERIMNGNIFNIPRDEIISKGYVVNTLESALWCFLKNSNYESTILTAVNLGGDTDTTAAVCGGLAGLYYGYYSIPTSYIMKLRGKNVIDKYINKFISTK